MIEDQLRQGARRSDHSGNRDQHGSEENSKEKPRSDNDRGCHCAFNLDHLLGSVINMGVMAISSGSILLFLIAAKRLI